MIKEYYYKFGDLPIQNIGTGNVEHQAIIEKHLTDHLISETIGAVSKIGAKAYTLSSDKIFPEPELIDEKIKGVG